MFKRLAERVVGSVTQRVIESVLRMTFLHLDMETQMNDNDSQKMQTIEAIKLANLNNESLACNANFLIFSLLFVLFWRKLRTCALLERPFEPLASIVSFFLLFNIQFYGNETVVKMN